MDQKSVLKALFKEIHKSIEEASVSVVEELQGVGLSYPPGVELTMEEKMALDNLALSDAAGSGLKKLIADACAYPMFHFFSLLDGIVDPETELDEVWQGAILVDKPESDETMLHDEFYESFWAYKEGF